MITNNKTCNTWDVCIDSGLDVLYKDGFSQLRGLKLGLLTHAAAVDKNLKHILTLLLNFECDIRIILAPEHGLSASAQDMVSVSSSFHSLNKIRIKSLYGSNSDSLKPTDEDLYGLDALIVDLQDVGSRYYTFAQTMAFSMQIAKRVGIKVVVIDRPNPISGTIVEGANLFSNCKSFCVLILF